ncbi:aldo/keto reductase [Streptomyces viridochromogenes]|uniref:aldo/keto reductase n=1 Tax=Streptomyces viridochromogenes TaxID=1938 RepID=UPI003F7E9428
MDALAAGLPRRGHPGARTAHSGAVAGELPAHRAPRGRGANGGSPVGPSLCGRLRLHRPGRRPRHDHGRPPNAPRAHAGECALRGRDRAARAAAPGALPDERGAKVGPYRAYHGEWGMSARPGQLRGHVEENLRRLGRDHLDVVYLRRMRQDSIAEHFGALAELREAGLIRHLGVSAVEPRHLAEARAVAPVVRVQNRYAVDRPDPVDDEVLRLCGEQGIAFVPFYAVAGEAGAEGATTSHEAEVLAVARAHGASPTQVRIAWTLHQGPHVLAIPGTGDPDHLVENVAAGALRLTADEPARLDAARRNAG